MRYEVWAQIKINDSFPIERLFFNSYPDPYITGVKVHPPGDFSEITWQSSDISENQEDSLFSFEISGQIWWMKKMLKITK